MPDSLQHERCLPCEGGVPPLSEPESQQLLTQLQQSWQLDDNAHRIERLFRFADFHATMAFVNAVADIAHQQDHHPTLQVGYNMCRVSFTTHAIQGLSRNDFICAAGVDAITR